MFVIYSKRECLCKDFTDIVSESVVYQFYFVREQMENINNIYRFILEINKLKLVFRNTTPEINRRESTAEHSWSAAMIVMILAEKLKEEFGHFDEMKTIKLALIHDLVEIYAGDVIAFDTQARKDKEKIEAEALDQLIEINPEFGKQLHALWYEFEARETLEAKIAKAADSICPIFVRLHARQSYVPFDIKLDKLEATKAHVFSFSKTFNELFQKLKSDLLAEQLINI